MPKPDNNLALPRPMTKSWHTHTATMGRDYVLPDILFALSLPPKMMVALAWLLWAGVIWMVVRAAFSAYRTRCLRIGSLLVLAAALCTFYVGLVGLVRRDFFIISLLVGHGLQYHVWIVDQGVRAKKYPFHLPKFVVAMLIFGFFGILLERYQGFAVGSVAALAAAVAFMHYVWDALLWRRNSRMLSREAPTAPIFHGATPLGALLSGGVDAGVSPG